MAVTLADFETLQYCSIANLVGQGWSAPLLTANYGAGYGAGVIANSSYGLNRWTIATEILQDTQAHLVIYTVDGDEVTSPKFTYFFEFFKRHILRGNKPFIILDTRENKSYLVAFDVAQIDFGRITSKFFSLEGLPIVERRHKDLEFNADGSLILPDTTPPTVPTGLTAETGGAEGEVDIDWTESTDEEAEVTGYVLRIRVPE
jgi:hypothetical protein